MNSNFIFKFAVILFVSAILSRADFVFAGTIDSIYKYAWSPNAGWINFNTVGAGSPVISNSEITGWVWNNNYGWINLSPDGSGIKNDGEGNLSGAAWGENTGWIDFGGVVINSDGKFTGTATGDAVGQINFDCDNCDVVTDWRPQSQFSGGGSAGTSNYTSLGSDLFGVSLDSGKQLTNKTKTILNLSAPLGIKKVEISNSADFSESFLTDYQNTVDWTLLSGDGKKTVYARFYNSSGNSSDIISDSIVLNTTPPALTIADSRTFYSYNENIVLSGQTEGYAIVSLLIDNSYYSQFSADKNGKWSVDLGEYSIGSHSLQFTPTDSSGNSGTAVDFKFSVQGEIPQGGIVATGTASEVKPSLISQIEDQIVSIWKQITGQISQETGTSLEVVIIPVEAPLALSGKVGLLEQKRLDEFVLADLPTEIKVIAQKFPEVAKTLTEVGITKVSDITNLKSTTLSLPTITESVGLAQVELRSGEFIPLKGVPIAQLTSTAKSKVPSEIIFAKAGGGLVDFNTAMSINDKGEVQQTISTVSGETMQFIVKVDSPAKTVKGYLIFNSSNVGKVSSLVSLNDLAASLVFAAPNLSSVQKETVEEQVAKTSQRMVVSRFDYINTGDGVYVADVPMPAVSGEYEVVAVIDYEDEFLSTKEVNLITVIDPEGYIYEKNGKQEIRISGVVVSLYYLNPETKKYELWPAKNYQQQNPQVTDKTGNYAFLVPEGYYYINVTSPGYMDYEGKPFEVVEGSGVHTNIGLSSKYWYLEFFDWKMALLAIIVLLLIYNFYRDRRRERILLKKNNNL